LRGRKGKTIRGGAPGVRLWRVPGAPGVRASEVRASDTSRNSGGSLFNAANVQDGTHSQQV